MKRLLIVVFTTWVCQLVISCKNTAYLTPDNCYTCSHIICSNEEYSDEKHGYWRKKQDSLFAEMRMANPESVAPKTLKGSFKVIEIWKELDVAVFFLEDLSKPMDVSRVKQVISLIDKPSYKGETLKVGNVYYFELSPLYPLNVAPSYDCYHVEGLLFENRWLLIQHYSGENIFSSVNLNGDKYINTFYGE